MRMSKWRRMSAAGLLLALTVVLLAACGSDSDSGTGGTTGGGGSGSGDKGALAMSFGDQSVEVWKAELEKMKPIIEAAGYEFLADDPKNDVQTQANDWRAWINRGDVKAIMGYPIQVDALLPVTKEATDAGIPVLGYAATWPGTKGALVTNPRKDGEILGKKTAEWINETYGDEPVRVAVVGGRSSDLIRERTEGISAALKAEAPNVQIDELSPELDRTEAFNQAKAEIQRRGKVPVWVGVSDDIMHGVYQALEQSGVATDDPKTYIGALDMTNPSLDLIGKPNNIWRVGYTFDVNELAKINTDLLIAAAGGKPTKNELIKPTLVTPENYKQFYLE
jgi:ribose transport system substrate-binding protein